MNPELDAFVGQNIVCCMSSIIYDIGQHPDEAAKVFDLSADEIYDWFSVLDYEEAMGSAIDRLDLCEMIEECDEVGYSSDALDKAGAPKGCDLYEWVESRSPEEKLQAEKVVRAYLEDNTTEHTDRQEFCERHGVDLDYFTCEVCEHWAVDSWFGEKLAAKGECVFEFGGLTIWGRCTTGQSISMDGVVEEVYKETIS